MRMCFGSLIHQQVNISNAADTSATGSAEVVSIECDQCGKAFESRSQLFSHKAKIHGYRNQYRYLVEGSTCLHCNMCFHERFRLFRHVAYKSRNCGLFYACTVTPMSEERAVELEAVDTAARKDRKASKRPSAPAIKAT